MSITEQNEPAAAIVSPPPTHPATVVVSHEGADGMGERSMTVGRYEEIRRRLADGRGVREIARAVNRHPSLTRFEAIRPGIVTRAALAIRRKDRDPYAMTDWPRSNADPWSTLDAGSQTCGALKASHWGGSRL